MHCGPHLWEPRSDGERGRLVDPPEAAGVGAPRTTDWHILRSTVVVEGGPLLDCPSLDTGSLSFLAPLAPRSALEGLSPPWVFVAHVLLAVHSCDLAQLFPLSGPQFPFPPNTVKAFPAPTCCDWVWKPAPPEGWAPPPVPSPCPAQGWHDVRAHSTLIDSERSSRQRP